MHARSFVFLALVACAEDAVPGAPTAPIDTPPETSSPADLPRPPPADPAAEVARLVMSRPADGDPAFYPVEVYQRSAELGVGERAVLRFVFDRPMSTSEASVEIAGALREGAWQPDGRTLEVTLPGTEDAPPLAAETDHEVRLDRLRAATSAAVEPAQIRFRTAARDAVVEHACIHTLYGPFANATASARGGAIAEAPLVASVHRQWSVELPAEGAAFAGQARVSFTGTGERRYLLYLDRDVPVTLATEAGGVVDASTTTAPAACPGIQRVATVTLARGTSYRMALGPAPSGSVKLIWEAQ